MLENKYRGQRLTKFGSFVLQIPAYPSKTSLDYQYLPQQIKDQSETSLRFTASGLDKSTGRVVPLPPVLLRCCCVPQDGLGTTGVRPVPPSINESKLNPGIPDDGVVMAIPAISCQLLEDRGGAFAKGEATGNDVGRGRGAVVGRVNSIKPSDEESSLSCRSSLIIGCWT